jgi:pyruvate, water dikinase
MIVMHSFFPFSHHRTAIFTHIFSDYPEFSEFLVKHGIDSISLNPDVVLKTMLRIVEME